MQLHALPAREHHGITGRIGIEQQRRTFAHMQIHIALETDRAGEELPGRHFHATAALLRARGNGLGNGGGVESRAIRARPEVR